MVKFKANNDQCKCDGCGHKLCMTCLRNLAECGDYQTWSLFKVVKGKCKYYINAYPKK